MFFFLFRMITNYSYLFLFGLALCLPFIFGKVQEIQTPIELQECFFYKSLNTSVAEVPGKLIEDFCLRKYSLSQYEENTQKNISAEGVRYLESLYRQIDAETQLTRKKRQTTATWRVRSEIRTLSAAQRNRIFGCLNRLKRDFVSTFENLMQIFLLYYVTLSIKDVKYIMHTAIKMGFFKIL